MKLTLLIKKTQSLLNYGTKKVIWVTSLSHKVLIAEGEGEKDWLLRDWNKDFELMKGITANIGKYLKDKGIKV